MATPDFPTLINSVFNDENPTNPPLVEVLWFDAEDIAAGWAEKEDMDKSCPTPSLSVGYLFHKDKFCVKVLPLVNKMHFANGITIPMGMVLQINYLTRKK